MARKRSTSRSRAATPKSPSRSPGRPARKSATPSPTRGAKATPARAAKTPQKTPSRPKTPQKSPPRPKTPTKVATASSTSSSRTRLGSTSNPILVEPRTRTESPVNTPNQRETRHEIITREYTRSPELLQRSPSPTLSTRPRRAAAIAANRELMGQESARTIRSPHPRLIEPTRTKSVFPTVTWPKWTRDLKNHVRRYPALYSSLLTAIFVSIIAYYCGKTIIQQLNTIERALVDIYEEQRKRLDTIWESPTEKSEKIARESALPAPPPPHREPPPTIPPPNPHIPKVPKQQQL